jgi:phage terminase large subunit
MHPEPETYATWTEKGVLAYESTRQYLYTLFGGAKGGSKTVTGCRIYQTDISNYRGGLFVVMRRNYTDLRVTTRASFDRFFPPHLIIEKKSDVWHCANDNDILWWAADPSRDPGHEKTRGLEASAIFYDESSQQDEQLYGILPSLLRRDAFHIDTGEPLHKYIYQTANPVPGQHHLKRTFISPKSRRTPGGPNDDGRHNFIRSLPDDNAYLSDSYIADAFSTMTDEMVLMYRFGHWDVEESEFVIVPAKDVEALIVPSIIDRSPVAAGIDIGLGRPDKTVVYCSNAAGEVWREMELEEYDTMKQVEALQPICRLVANNGGKTFVDNGSVGKGVADALIAGSPWGTVEGVNFGEAAVEEGDTQGGVGYENRRAQMYWWARNEVKAATVRVEENEILKEELANTYFLPADGKFKLEPKKNIRERLGRSPDDSDAFVLCIAARRAARLNDFTLPSRNDRSSEGQVRRRRESPITAGY